MLLRTTLHLSRRSFILIALLACFLTVGYVPGQAARSAKPVLQTGCDSNYDTIAHPGRYTRIATQVYSLTAKNWDIYSTDPCYPSGPRARLTTAPAFDGYPSINFNATRVVFVSERDGGPEIYIMNIDGSSQTRLTNNQFVETAPSFSPDGGKIVFVTDRDGNSEVYVMNADGSGQTRLTSNTVQDYDPSWSPDGEKIIWMRGTVGASQVFVMNSNGSNPIPLTVPLSSAGRPIWSPKGNRLAFEADADNDGWKDLVVMNSDGTNAQVMPITKRVTTTNGEDVMLGSWYTDGSGLFYSQPVYTLYGNQWMLNRAFLYGMSLTGSLIDIDAPSDPSFFPSAASVDPYPPTVSLKPLPAYSRFSESQLYWAASETGGSGIVGYKLEVSVKPNGVWSSSHFGCSQLSITNPSFWSGTCVEQDSMGDTESQPGDTVAYRLWVTDDAGNETFSPEMETTLYSFKMEGRVADSRGYPLPFVQVQGSTDNLIRLTESDLQGKAAAYYRAKGPVTTSFSAAGYGSYPPQTWPLQRDGHFQANLPPSQNLITNGDFESQEPVSGWQVGGSLPVQSGTGLSGENAALLGGQCDNHLCFNPFETYTTRNSTSTSLVTSSDGVTHLLAYLSNGSGGMETVYFTRQRNGTWSGGQVIPHASKPTSLMIASDDTLYFRYVNDTNLAESLAFKTNGGDWAYESIPNLNTSTFVYNSVIDTQNRFHLIYGHAQGGIRYIRREANGSWVGPFLLAINPQHDNTLNFLLAGGPDGTVHLVYQEVYSVLGNAYPLPPNYAQLASDGSLIAGRPLPLFYPGTGGWDSFKLNSLSVSADGTIHVLASNRNHGFAVYWNRTADGNWSDPEILTGDSFKDFRMAVGHAGEVTILSEQTYGTLVHYYYRPAGGTTSFTHWQPDLGKGYNNLTTAMNNYGQLQIVLNGLNGYTPFFAQLMPPSQAGQATIQQTVAIAANLPNPTLSFRYKIEQEYAGPASGFVVTVQPEGGNPSVVYTSTTERGSWLHGWADLTAWAGQTVTVAFQLNQVADEWYTRLLLDEISLGKWNTPIIQSISPVFVAPAEGGATPLRLHGLNLTGVSQVFFGNHPAAQVSEDSETGDLLVTLPVGLPYGIHNVRALYPDGRQAFAPQPFQFGYLQYTPFISRGRH